MRERAKLVGGKLTVWSELDAGTELELSILHPLRMQNLRHAAVLAIRQRLVCKKIRESLMTSQPVHGQNPNEAAIEISRMRHTHVTEGPSKADQRISSC